jgi:hypothetical protein
VPDLVELLLGDQVRVVVAAGEHLVESVGGPVGGELRAASSQGRELVVDRVRDEGLQRRRATAARLTRPRPTTTRHRAATTTTRTSDEHEHAAGDPSA